MKLAPKQLESRMQIDTWKPRSGRIRTLRYSFEITEEIATLLEARVMAEQTLHKKRISTSSVIRQALKDYLITKPNKDKDK